MPSKIAWPVGVWPQSPHSMSSARRARGCIDQTSSRSSLPVDPPSSHWAASTSAMSSSDASGVCQQRAGLVPQTGRRRRGSSSRTARAVLPAPHPERHGRRARQGSSVPASRGMYRRRPACMGRQGARPLTLWRVGGWPRGSSRPSGVCSDVTSGPCPEVSGWAPPSLSAPALVGGGALGSRCRDAQAIRLGPDCGRR